MKFTRARLGVFLPPLPLQFRFFHALSLPFRRSKEKKRQPLTKRRRNVIIVPRVKQPSNERSGRVCRQPRVSPSKISFSLSLPLSLSLFLAERLTLFRLLVVSAYFPAVTEEVEPRRESREPYSVSVSASASSVRDHCVFLLCRSSLSLSPFPSRRKISQLSSRFPPAALARRENLSRKISAPNRKVLLYRL